MAARVEIPAELERELFKRFWLWLGVVGSLLSLAVSVVVTFLVQSTINVAANAAQDKLDQITSNYGVIDTRALQSAQTIGMAQARSEQAALAAETAAKTASDRLNDFNAQLAASQNALLATNSIAEIAEKLKVDPLFAGLIAGRVDVAGKLKISLVRSEIVQQHAEVSCSQGAVLISAACIGFNPSPQAAVGPQYNDAGTVASCDRYSGTVMPVQATAICLSSN